MVNAVNLITGSEACICVLLSTALGAMALSMWFSGLWEAESSGCSGLYAWRSQVLKLRIAQKTGLYARGRLPIGVERGGHCSVVVS